MLHDPSPVKSKFISVKLCGSTKIWPFASVIIHCELRLPSPFRTIESSSIKSGLPSPEQKVKGPPTILCSLLGVLIASTTRSSKSQIEILDPLFTGQ